jgi:hypothetical protein
LLLGDKEQEGNRVPVLDFDDAPVSRPRKNLRLILGVGTIAAVVGVSSTLASSITLNGGGDVEFGQGILTTAACDGEVIITPVSTFSNSNSTASPSPTAARYPLSSIKVSGIDLTPEGWDFSNDDFHVGFTPGNPSTRSWNANNKQYAGKYLKDDTWTKTCEGKVLLLRAYTNDDEYAGYTVEGIVNSPLWLNRPVSGGGGMAPTSGPRNAGVGFRLYALPPTSGATTMESLRFITDIFNDNGNRIVESDFGPILPGWEFGFDPAEEIEILSDSLFVIFLDEDPLSLPALDSRWVNRITIESRDTPPSGWGAKLNTVVSP